MVRNFASILLISLACVIQLIHSVVPHSHHQDHVDQHHHNHDSEDQSIFHLFSHYQHSTETFTSQTEDAEINITRELQALKSKEYVIAQSFGAKPLPTTAYVGPFIYISPHLVSLQFRGPPTV